MSVIQFPTDTSKIDIEILKSSTQKTVEGIIQPAKESVSCELVSEHSADPIKSIDDIYKITNYLVSNKRYRDNMMFIVGLRTLRFSNIINSNFTFKDSFAVFEKKTRNTRKRKKNRYITLNKAVIDAVTLYLENTPNVCLSDYMFRSESNRGGQINNPLSAKSIDRILKGIANDLDLNIKMSTHTLRKTFCYHQMLMSHNDNRKLLLLQKMLGHASPAQTLDYIGITAEEVEEAYRNLNLGSIKYSYLRGNNIVEIDNYVG